jgi:ABC-type Co2+ transport system permease subunit
MKRTILVGALACVVVLSVALGLQAASSVPQGGILVSPSTLVMGSEGVWVTVHADIPYRIVDAATVTLNGVPVSATFADNQGELVAKFQIDAVKGTVSPPSAEVELVARTYDGDEFVGTDTVRVIQDTGR